MEEISWKTAKCRLISSDLQSVYSRCSNRTCLCSQIGVLLLWGAFDWFIDFFGWLIDRLWEKYWLIDFVPQSNRCLNCRSIDYLYQLYLYLYFYISLFQTTLPSTKARNDLSFLGCSIGGWERSLFRFRNGADFEWDSIDRHWIVSVEKSIEGTKW